MPAEFYGTGLVHGDVAGLGSYYSGVAGQHGVNYGGIRLRTEYQEEDIGLRAANHLADAILRAKAEGIEAVAGLLLHVGLGKRLKNQGMRALVIVAGKRNDTHFAFVFTSLQR